MGRRTLVLVIAVLLAAISGYAVYQYLTSVEEDIKADISEVVVYRATAPIETKTLGPEAEPFIAESTALREHVVFDGSTILCLGASGSNASLDPASFGCVRNPSDLASVLDGKVAAGPIATNQLITQGSFVDIAETEIGLNESLAPGKVAISVNFDGVASSGGFIRPGDNVNIIATRSLSPFDFLSLVSNEELRNIFFVEDPVEGEEEVVGETPVEDGEELPPTNLLAALPTSYEIAETIFQEIQVLAVGMNTRPAPQAVGLEPVGAQIIVFEVTPQQAEELQFAAAFSSLSLVLLPAEGTYIPYDAQVIVVDDIFGLLERISAELGLVLGEPGN